MTEKSNRAVVKSVSRKTKCKAGRKRKSARTADSREVRLGLAALKVMCDHSDEDWVADFLFRHNLIAEDS